MAMNNMNYGYPSASGFPASNFSPPYTSTPPSAPRTHRPRFAYSGPTSYPRPRSSASKPNPDSLADSMINNYGNSTDHLDASFSSENSTSYNNSFRSQNSSANYYSCNESFYRSPERPPAQHANTDNVGYLRDPTPQFTSNYNNCYDVNSGTNTGRFQKNPEFTQNFVPNPPAVGNKKTFVQRKFFKAKRKMTDKGTWKCELCSLDFTSHIPLEMHLRGAKHAKKLKAQNALQAIKTQVSEGQDINTEGKSFRCELCNVTANSSLQLQTHLEGTKHKSKVQQLQQPKEVKTAASDESKPEGAAAAPLPATTQVNGKTNEAYIRPLPSEFGEPQPAKLAKYSCDLCSVIVNSEIQLQQHLTSKKHQAKVEGKPLTKAKKNKRKQGDDPDAESSNLGENSAPSLEENSGPSESTTNQETSEATKIVMGVKTLAASFVQGETLH
ncbi:Zinc finger protein 385A, partial [Stegodyphus mimosarum]